MSKRALSMGMLAAGALAFAASAQVTPVGPFTGDESEGFEGKDGGFQPCVTPNGVFNDTAELCTPGNSGAHTTSGWGFRCSIFPVSGSKLYGSAGGYSEYEFDTPVKTFGGYFGTNAYQLNETPGADINFLDDAGNVIDSVRLDFTNDCTWTWNGWETQGALIKRVEVINDIFGGAFVMMDDMEYLLSSADCLTMQVSDLTAGQNAVWRVDGATPGEQVAIVWGTNPGSTPINGFAGYCATFGIQGVSQNRVVCRKDADGAGVVSCNRFIPTGAQGLRVLSQAAERNTCPDECVSNLDDQTVQ